MNLTKLDKVFSEYIRRRDADESGYVKCCTCPTVKHWKEMDAGHYITRSHLMTRWGVLNVNTQCHECNVLKNGHLFAYKIYLISVYGDHIISYLNTQKFQIWKPMPYEIDEMVEVYKQKIKEL